MFYLSFDFASILLSLCIFVSLEIIFVPVFDRFESVFRVVLDDELQQSLKKEYLQTSVNCLGIVSIHLDKNRYVLAKGYEI